jgi:hypothetical protein
MTIGEEYRRLCFHLNHLQTVASLQTPIIFHNPLPIKKGNLEKVEVDLVALVPDQNLLDVVVGGVGLQLVQPVLDFLKQMKNCQLN